METLIIALGGNALIKKGQRGTAEEQFKNLKTPLRQIAQLVEKYRIVITHGNGPQVGNRLLQQEASDLPKMPLEILVAETQGQIGYMIEQTLDNELMSMGIDNAFITTMITYVQVDKDDPAFQHPTKPVGPVYPDERPGCVKVSGGWRRVVPSPKPQKIIEWREVKLLLDNNFTVIAGGGGGIPVTNGSKAFEGIEAVIDKDLCSAKLGEQIGADILIIATEASEVTLNFGTPEAKPLRQLKISDAKKYLAEGQFPAGSMGPKVQAAINFLEAGKSRAVITSMEVIDKALRGEAGTEFIRD